MMSIITALYCGMIFIAIMYFGTEIVDELKEIHKTLKGETCDEEISDS